MFKEKRVNFFVSATIKAFAKKVNAIVTSPDRSMQIPLTRKSEKITTKNKNTRSQVQTKQNRVFWSNWQQRKKLQSWISEKNFGLRSITEIFRGLDSDQSRSFKYIRINFIPRTKHFRLKFVIYFKRLNFKLKFLIVHNLPQISKATLRYFGMFLHSRVFLN